MITKTHWAGRFVQAIIDNDGGYAEDAEGNRIAMFPVDVALVVDALLREDRCAVGEDDSITIWSRRFMPDEFVTECLAVES